MVAVLIERKYRIKLAPNSVGRLLAQLGITCQKPLHRALECDEALVQKWLKTEYPKIKKMRSEEHTSELQSHSDLVCRLLLEKKKKFVNQQVLCKEGSRH